ncbi:MAG: hypothetical protein CSB06_03410 [Bacteroidia bacterium]|nr:MAG: hypothetical protein CSB06_03410 [Bacteroidia bacterium]
MKKMYPQTAIFLIALMLLGNSITTAQNMDRYISLTIKKGADIRLALSADANGTPIKIVSGSNVFNVTVGTAWSTYRNFPSDASTMIIYGDLKSLGCAENQSNLIGLDISKNTQLESLSCDQNQLTSLDVSKNIWLVGLVCAKNQLTGLDVSQNRRLELLNCSDNQLTNLDVSQNKRLELLHCTNNQLKTLDLSQNPYLEGLACDKNRLTSLNVSQNKELRWLYAYGNPFTTKAIDELFCSLPDKTDQAQAKICILNDSSDKNYKTVLAANKQNAINKNWLVKYAENSKANSNSKDIPNTTGTYECLKAAQ